MTPSQAQEFVKDIFSHLEKCKSFDALDSTYSLFKIEDKFRTDTKPYPRLGITITKDEILQLINLNVLTKDHKFESLAASQIQNPTSKLLFALAWKNGDLNKIEHIIRGVLESSSPFKCPKNGIVFYQFGRHLGDPSNNPIIDQHVIRSIATRHASESDLPKTLKLDEITIKWTSEIERYFKWFNKYCSTRDQNWQFWVDQILVATGKKIKNTGANNGYK